MRYFRRPAQNDDWEPEVAVQAGVVMAGDSVQVDHLRCFSYQARDEFTPHYESRVYELSGLASVDMVVSHWTGDLIAHVFLSFGFEGGEYVAISIEIRRRRSQKYSALAGFFRQYEMFYVVADERDLIGQRAAIRREEVYLYRLMITPEIRRNLLLSYLHRIQKLGRMPEFYNTLTNNCTTNIFRHANDSAKLVPFNWKVLASGYADRYAYDLGVLNQTVPFQTLKAASRISPDISPEDVDYAMKIRAGLVYVRGF